MYLQKPPLSYHKQLTRGYIHPSLQPRAMTSYACTYACLLSQKEVQQPPSGKAALVRPAFVTQKTSIYPQCLDGDKDDKRELATIVEGGIEGEGRSLEIVVGGALQDTRDRRASHWEEEIDFFSAEVNSQGMKNVNAEDLWDVQQTKSELHHQIEISE